MEQEPGSAGVTVADHYARHVLSGYTFHAERSTGDKATRAQPLAAAAGIDLSGLGRRSLLAAGLGQAPPGVPAVELCDPRTSAGRRGLI